MFWSGLDPKLRETSGHLHFMIKDFDKLKLAMREQEVDFKKEARPQPAKMMTQTGTDDNTQSEFTSMLHQLIADVKDLKERDTQYSNKYQNNNRGGSNFRNSNTNYRGNRSNYHNQGHLSEQSNTDQGQITLDYKEEDDNDSLIFDQVEYNVNDTADVSINDPLPTQDTGSVVAGDALHPGDQSEDDEQEHSVSLESEVESGQESTIIVDDDIEHSNSDINQGSETNDIVVNNQEDIAPTPAPRRSKRTTTQPNWMKSGEFIMAQQSNWLAKAEFLKD
ncbi:unnamed protein product [Mytilus coruscus]|uniref:Uncharacterized protein n=1 Tax=Mytilus coruscus TaxID=42192 RepID=A0A6J8D818_MYTCO|nr:unnamed protein product [Mytilus coruscus]